MEEAIGSIFKTMINAMGVPVVVFRAEPTSSMQIKTHALPNVCSVPG